MKVLGETFRVAIGLPLLAGGAQVAHVTRMEEKGRYEKSIKAQKFAEERRQSHIAFLQRKEDDIRRLLDIMRKQALRGDEEAFRSSMELFEQFIKEYGIHESLYFNAAEVETYRRKKEGFLKEAELEEALLNKVLAERKALARSKREEELRRQEEKINEALEKM
jgi:hypothetical protein